MISEEDAQEKWHHERGLPWGKTFLGPYPVMIRRMSRKVLQNLTVHLGNEHGISSSNWETGQVQHMEAHMYGRFRPGQEHYHEAPEATGSLPHSAGPPAPEERTLEWHEGKHSWEEHDGYPKHCHSLNGLLTIDQHDSSVHLQDGLEFRRKETE